MPEKVELQKLEKQSEETTPSAFEPLAVSPEEIKTLALKEAERITPIIIKKLVDFVGPRLRFDKDPHPKSREKSVRFELEHIRESTGFISDFGDYVDVGPLYDIETYRFDPDTNLRTTEQMSSREWTEKNVISIIRAEMGMDFRSDGNMFENAVFGQVKDLKPALAENIEKTLMTGVATAKETAERIRKYRGAQTHFGAQSGLPSRSPFSFS
jgi:hypothetical protein